MKESDITLLKEAVHTIKDYPKEGILFRDVMGILENSEAFALTINTLKAKFENKGFTKIVGNNIFEFFFHFFRKTCRGIISFYKGFNSFY